jgi:ABC-type cobalamin/Fe3+-siderophores transport system ATPase subunit
MLPEQQRLSLLSSFIGEIAFGSQNPHPDFLNIEFHLVPLTAIIGPVGCGKSAFCLRYSRITPTWCPSVLLMI